jgi:hypothetical protein
MKQSKGHVKELRQAKDIHEQFFVDTSQMCCGWITTHRVDSFPVKDVHLVRATSRW